MSQSTNELLDLPEIEERRARARTKQVTASDPVITPVEKYRVCFFGCFFVEIFQRPEVSRFARWVLGKLNIKITKQE